LVRIVLLSGRFHIRVPDRAGRSAKVLRTIPENGCKVYSCSNDSVYDHKAWHEANANISQVEFPMLADPAAYLAKDLDIYEEADGRIDRGDFILDPEGKVVAYEVTSSNVGRNAEEILRRLQASQFVYEHGDRVCPANWHPGDETIKKDISVVGKL
jgi:alkyl hydroperoxide reductase subunit AhpC